MAEVPSKEPDYYKDLGVTPQESHYEIRKAYDILIAGINLISRSHNPSLAAHSDEERSTIERAWVVLGDEDERKEYDLRRGATKSEHGRYSLGYEAKTGTARRPSAPKTRNSEPVGGQMGSARRSAALGASGGGAEFGFDGFLGFGKAVGGGNGVEKEKRKRGFSDSGGCRGEDQKKENKPF